MPPRINTPAASPRMPQGHGLVKLIMLDGLLACAALGFHWVNGSYEPRKRRTAYFRDLGFAEVGPVIQFRLESGFSEPSQLILLEVTPPLCAAWTQRKAAVIRRLQDKGFQIEDYGCNAQAIRESGGKSGE